MKPKLLKLEKIKNDSRSENDSPGTFGSISSNMSSRVNEGSFVPNVKMNSQKVPRNTLSLGPHDLLSAKTGQFLDPKNISKLKRAKTFR